mmetsp:Transcript_15785/g.61679  ORF Transcript_15785/g.61679 Transcript_15785/m.61679 type:complete len:242 (-) Transcript_15785:33-758(-)
MRECHVVPEHLCVTSGLVHTCDSSLQRQSAEESLCVFLEGRVGVGRLLCTRPPDAVVVGLAVDGGLAVRSWEAMLGGQPHPLQLLASWCSGVELCHHIDARGGDEEPPRLLRRPHGVNVTEERVADALGDLAAFQQLELVGLPCGEPDLLVVLLVKCKAQRRRDCLGRQHLLLGPIHQYEASMRVEEGLWMLGSFLGSLCSNHSLVVGCVLHCGKNIGPVVQHNREEQITRCHRWDTLSDR